MSHFPRGVQWEEAEAQLRQRTIREGFFLPSYDGLGIVNLPSSILKSLGCRYGNVPPLNKSFIPFDAGYNTVIVILVDALGWNLLRRSEKEINQLKRLVSSFEPIPITTVFPSTTSTVLTSLNTGVPPAKHGIVGYSMYLKELGAICNMLDFKIINAPRDESIFEKGIQPDTFLGVQTIHQQLFSNGLASFVVTKNYLINSGLSRISHAGSTTVGYVDVGDMFVLLRKLLEKNSHLTKYIFVYWPSVDTASHNFGPWGEETLAEMRSFVFSLYSEFLDKLSPNNRKDSVLLITGDHGHSEIKNGNVYDVSSDSQFMNMLTVPPTGDARASFLHVKNGMRDRIVNYIQKKYDQVMYTMTIDELSDSGLLGSTQLRQGLEDRLGDLLVIPEGGHAIFYPFKNERVFTQRGAHAGLTDDELFVPLFVIPL